MRGIRYIAFPPVVFETRAPAPLADVQELPEEPVQAPTIEPPVEATPEAVPALARPAVVTLESPVPKAAPWPRRPHALTPVKAVVWPSNHTLESAPVPLRAEPDFERPAPPGPVMRPLTAEPAPSPARLRRLTELSAAEMESPVEASAPRRFALLNELEVELRPRRVRARAAKREWP